MVGDTPPPYWGKIPTPPAPSYLQTKQSKATKWSPPRAAMPKTKHSGSKGGHHSSSGRSLNTSTPEHPDSTSAKKPSSSKEPLLKEQDKSPRSHGSRKHSCSPLHPPSQMDVSGKRPAQKTPANSTPPSPLAPVGLMTSAV